MADDEIVEDVDEEVEDDDINEEEFDADAEDDDGEFDVWYRSENGNIDIMSGRDNTVYEYGPADWDVARRVFLGFTEPVEPNVFAPNEWP